MRKKCENGWPKQVRKRQPKRCENERRKTTKWLKTSKNRGKMRKQSGWVLFVFWLPFSSGHISETGRIRFRRARFQTPNSVSSFCSHRVLGRELSEFLSAYYVCDKANSPSFSQNSPSLPQNSVRLSEFSSLKQCSRNSIPPVSWCSGGHLGSSCGQKILWMSRFCLFGVASKSWDANYFNILPLVGLVSDHDLPPVLQQ